MNIKMIVFANRNTGWGHWYRSIALAEHIQSQNHQVTIISDRTPPKPLAWHCVSYDDPALWRGPLYDSDDWLLIDLPDEAPEWLYDLCQNRGIKTCVLNGVGHQCGDRADLRIIQGLTDDELGPKEYAGVDFIILRPAVFEAKKISNQIVDWFVFGGASDKLNLTRKFPNWQRIVFTISPNKLQVQDREDDGFLLAAAQCKRACIAMGVTAWELSAIGLPVYAFSLTPLHLQFALEMDKAGYIKAYPKVGIPSKRSFRNFLSVPFTPTGKPIDGLACQRILQLMEHI